MTADVSLTLHSVSAFYRLWLTVIKQLPKLESVRFRHNADDVSLLPYCYIATPPFYVEVKRCLPSNLSSRPIMGSMWYFEGGNQLWHLWQLKFFHPYVTSRSTQLSVYTKLKSFSQMKTTYHSTHNTPKREYDDIFKSAMTIGTDIPIYLRHF